MSENLTAGQKFCNVLLFIIVVIPLTVIGLAFLVMGQGIERWVGAGVSLAFAFGVGQGIWRKLSS